MASGVTPVILISNLMNRKDYFCNNTSVQTFSFCQALNEQIAIKLADALNETHNKDLFPELGKFP